MVSHACDAGIGALLLQNKHPDFESWTLRGTPMHYSVALVPPCACHVLL
jgi:hypothetical protein